MCNSFLDMPSESQSILNENPRYRRLAGSKEDEVFDETDPDPDYKVWGARVEQTKLERIFQGILRKSTVRQRALDLPGTQQYSWFRSFWKLLLLFLIPTVGYMLAQWYPSSILFHFTFLCFVYGLVDLLEQDPTSPSYSPSLILATGGPQRKRRVDFVDGTKFYRLPKPITRRQKAVFGRQRFQYNYHHQQLEQDQSQPSQSSSPPLAQMPPVDWETANRLLKSALHSNEMAEAVEEPKFHDARASLCCGTTNTSSPPPQGLLTNNGSSEGENHSPDAPSPSKLIGGDSAIARLRMAAKPLYDLRNHR